MSTSKKRKADSAKEKEMVGDHPRKKWQLGSSSHGGSLGASSSKGSAEYFPSVPGGSALSGKTVSLRCVHVCSVAKSCLTLWDPVDCSPPGSCPWDFPGKNTGVGSHSLLQGIFPTQGPNLRLLPWQTNSFLLSHWEAHVSLTPRSKPGVDAEEGEPNFVYG